MPFSLQNIAISLYGFKLEKIRRSGEYKKFYAELLTHLKYNNIELRKYQERKLRELVKHAINTVPYYNKIFKKVGLEAEDIRSLEDLAKIPFLEKETVRTQTKNLISNKYKNCCLLSLQTTGTTGTPLTIYCDKRARRLHYAFYNRYLTEIGVNPFSKKAVIGGRIIIDPQQKDPPFWRYSKFQKSLLLSSYHISELTVIHYINALRKFQPEFIESYPSSIYYISKIALDKGINATGITKCIVTSGETLFEEQREVIEKAFGVPVFDQYGSAEMCIFVGQCKFKTYHIYTDYAIIEVVKDGRVLPPGEEGELVCTTFINKAMPLIRYKIGDKAILGNTRCLCGSDFPILKRLIGRTDDVIITPSGRFIGRLSPVLKGFPIIEAQYVQKEIDRIILYIVRAAGFSDKTRQQIIRELKKRFGNEMSIEIKYVNYIQRGKGGKFRNVISEIRKMA